MADLDLPDNMIEQGHPHEREEVRQGKDYFAESKAPEHPFGVLYQGEWETPFDGTAVAVRKHARALASTGIPVLLKSFSNAVVNAHGVAEPVPTVGVPAEVQREIGSLNSTSVGEVLPLIKHAVIPNAHKLAQWIMRGMAISSDNPEVYVAAQQAVYSATVMYSVWERSCVDADVATHLSELAECWVPCEHNKRLLLEAGVQRVRVVPHPFDPEEDVCKLVRRVPPPVRRFYAIGKWEPRKGFHELVGAFLRQFPVGTAKLTIKHSGGWPNYPTPDESVAQWVDDGSVRRNGWKREDFALVEGMPAGELEQGVVLISGRAPRSRIVELHYRNNIYVCSSHGEAWCLPAFDAKLAGNRLVHVPYGGTADFDGPGDVPVTFEMGAVPSSYNWEPGATWAQYNLWSLSSALGRAMPPTVLERPAGFDERFSMAAVGAQMATAVQQITKRLHPPAAEYYASRSR